jgi:hypothetical protein
MRLACSASFTCSCLRARGVCNRDALSPTLKVRSAGRLGVIVTSAPSMAVVYRSDSFSFATEQDPPGVCGSCTDFKAEHTGVVRFALRGRVMTLSLYCPMEP